MMAAPAHAQAWIEQSKICEDVQKTPDERIDACTRQLAALPEWTHSVRATALVQRSEANLATHKLGEAIADADAAVAEDEENIAAQNAKCWTRAVANRDLVVARAACDRGISLNREDAGVWDSRGLVNLREARWQAAWADYNQAYALRGEMIGSLYGRGLASLALGREEEGRADISMAINANPGVVSEFQGYGLTPGEMRAKSAKPASTQQ
ncbi:MAG TPA: hypothetical protein VG942_10430 [Hyphomonadaceae bacterium]|nr:hypothetical protein [Hyphomonadaceae bacterium]